MKNEKALEQLKAIASEFGGKIETVVPRLARLTAPRGSHWAQNYQSTIDFNPEYPEQIQAVLNLMRNGLVQQGNYGYQRVAGEHLIENAAEGHITWTHSDSIKVSLPGGTGVPVTLQAGAYVLIGQTVHYGDNKQAISVRLEVPYPPAIELSGGIRSSDRVTVEFGWLERDSNPNRKDLVWDLQGRCRREIERIIAADRKILAALHG